MLDTAREVAQIREGGIIPMILRQALAASPMRGIAAQQNPRGFSL